MNIFDEELLKQVARYKAIPAEQHAAEERLRQIQRDWEAAHTAIETEADRANPDEYPEEEE
jgi:antitoxin component of RelBE/YafQ-DinJ toxin-antitoxin module